MHLLSRPDQVCSLAFQYESLKLYVALNLPGMSPEEVFTCTEHCSSSLLKNTAVRIPLSCFSFDGKVLDDSRMPKSLIIPCFLLRINSIW